MQKHTPKQLGYASAEAGWQFWDGDPVTSALHSARRYAWPALAQLGAAYVQPPLRPPSFDEHYQLIVCPR